MKTVIRVIGVALLLIALAACQGAGLMEIIKSQTAGGATEAGANEGVYM